MEISRPGGSIIALSLSAKHLVWLQKKLDSFLPLRLSLPFMFPTFGFIVT